MQQSNPGTLLAFAFDVTHGNSILRCNFELCSKQIQLCNRMSLQFLRNLICNGSKKYIETRVSIGYANFAKAVSNHIMAVFLPPYYASQRSINFEMSF